MPMNLKLKRIAGAWRHGAWSTAIMLLFACGARGEVIVDFEDVAVPPGANSFVRDVTSRGVLFDSFLNHNHLARSVFRVDNGTTYLATDDAGGPSPLTMRPASGSLFRLFQLDLAEWDDEESTSRSVTITGNRSVGAPLVLLHNFDMAFNGAAPPADFQTITFSPIWTNLTSIVMKGSGSSDPLTNYFALDNIVINLVPEPSSLALLAIAALLGPAHLRRRRSAVRIAQVACGIAEAL